MSLLPFRTIESASELFEFDRFMDMLGEGASSLVYRAQMKITQCNSERLLGVEHTTNTIQATTTWYPQPVALKIIPKSKLDNERAIKDIINEVEIAKKVDHPSCMKFLDVVQTASEVFMVLELCDGEELFEIVRTAPGGKLPEEAAVVIAAQIVHAVTYLHDKRVVHRDLKPENIIVSGELNNPESLQVKVVDFGLAKYFGTSQRRRVIPLSSSRPQIRPSLKNFQNAAKQHGGGDSGLGFMLPAGFNPAPAHATSSGGGMQRSLSSMSMDSNDSADSHPNSPMLTTPCGTLKYNAPEAVENMVRNGGEKQQTTRADLPKRDVFSVGVILFIMLSGQIPFNGKTKAILHEQMSKGVSFDSPKFAKVSNIGKNFVAALLDINPARRPTAEEALKHPWLGPVASTLPALNTRASRKQQQLQQAQQQQQPSVSFDSSCERLPSCHAPAMPSRKRVRSQADLGSLADEERKEMSTAIDAMYSFDENGEASPVRPSYGNAASSLHDFQTSHTTLLGGTNNGAPPTPPAAPVFDVNVQQQQQQCSPSASPSTTAASMDQVGVDSASPSMTILSETQYSTTANHDASSTSPSSSASPTYYAHETGAAATSQDALPETATPGHFPKTNTNDSDDMGPRGFTNLMVTPIQTPASLPSASPPSCGPTTSTIQGGGGTVAVIGTTPNGGEHPPELQMMMQHTSTGESYCETGVEEN